MESLGPDVGPLVSNGVTYNFTAPEMYRFMQYDAPNGVCVSGVCLANAVGQATWTITLDTPADRVGGYLKGINESLTDIFFYDENNVLLGFMFPTQLNTTGYPSFFGFQTDAGRIKKNST